MQSRIVDLIGRVTDDELTAELLRINDELNNMFLRHQRYEKNRATTTNMTSPSAVLGAAMGVPTTNVPASNLPASNEPKLLDFPDANKDDMLNNFNRLGNTLIKCFVIPIFINDFILGLNSSTKPSNKDADEFDMLAQSRTNGNK